MKNHTRYLRRVKEENSTSRSGYLFCILLHMRTNTPRGTGNDRKQMTLQTTQCVFRMHKHFCWAYRHGVLAPIVVHCTICTRGDNRLKIIIFFLQLVDDNWRSIIFFLNAQGSYGVWFLMFSLCFGRPRWCRRRRRNVKQSRKSHQLPAVAVNPLPRSSRRKRQKSRKNPTRKKTYPW